MVFPPLTVRLTIQSLSQGHVKCQKKKKEIKFHSLGLCGEGLLLPDYTNFLLYIIWLIAPLTWKRRKLIVTLNNGTRGQWSPSPTILHILVLHACSIKKMGQAGREDEIVSEGRMREIQAAPGGSNTLRGIQTIPKRKYTRQAVPHDVALFSAIRQLGSWRKRQVNELPPIFVIPLITSFFTLLYVCCARPPFSLRPPSARVDEFNFTFPEWSGVVWSWSLALSGHRHASWAQNKRLGQRTCFGHRHWATGVIKKPLISEPLSSSAGCQIKHKKKLLKIHKRQNICYEWWSQKQMWTKLKFGRDWMWEKPAEGRHKMQNR